MQAAKEPPSRQYTSDDLQQLLKAQGITCSMSRRGDCWDNAAMQSFFSSMKTERLSRKVYRTREEARSDVIDYIERFYYPVRKHSMPDFLSPVDFEQGLMGQANRPGNWGKLTSYSKILLRISTRTPLRIEPRRSLI
ncbi:MAG: hypothetical protein EOO28_03145 [Comamonadaceae bacterium]|nr:MAG: hypothetical protein EOO28_03145 [Comamonadaceae bacterium]